LAYMHAVQHQCAMTTNTWSVKESCLRCVACTQAMMYRLKGTTLTSANNVDVEIGPHALHIVVKACVPSVKPVHQQWQRPVQSWLQWQQPPEQQWPPFALPQKPCQPGSWPCQLQPCCSSSPHCCSSLLRACWQLPACACSSAPQIWRRCQLSMLHPCSSLLLHKIKTEYNQPLLQLRIV